MIAAKAKDQAYEARAFAHKISMNKQRRRLEHFSLATQRFLLSKLGGKRRKRSRFLL